MDIFNLNLPPEENNKDKFPKLDSWFDFMNEQFQKIEDASHKNNCAVCGQEFDMRDLSQVFAHEPCDGNHKDYDRNEKIGLISSKKISSPEIFYKKVGTVNLN